MGVLAMLATILFTAALFAAAIFVLVIWKVRLLKYVFVAGFVWFLVYGLVLIGVSFSSQEESLSIGDNKRFCGFYLDCHMMAAVKSVERRAEYNGRRAKGEFQVVSIDVFSDARRAKLRLRSPEFLVSDENGNTYSAIPELSTSGSEFEQRIGPPEKISGVLVFDLPKKAHRLRLDVRSSDPIDSVIESLVIGDEDSLFHKRKYFSLEPSAQIRRSGSRILSSPQTNLGIRTGKR